MRGPRPSGMAIQEAGPCGDVDAPCEFAASSGMRVGFSLFGVAFLEVGEGRQPAVACVGGGGREGMS